MSTKSFVSSFINGHYDRVRCSSRQDASHLKLNGGKYRIPDELNEEFLAAYSKDVDQQEHQHCFTEVATAVFPFFCDFDVLDPGLSLRDCEDDAVKAEIAGWCTAAIHCVSGVLDPSDVALEQGSILTNDGDEPLSLLQLGFSYRNRLSPACSVTMSAPARTVTKYDVTGTKLGVHIIWPNLLINKADAQRLRNLIVVALYAEFPARNWDSIVDIAVYRPMASLRMLGSFKVRMCEACSTPAARAEKKAEFKQRADVIKILQLSEAQSSAGAVKKAALAAIAEKHARRVKLIAYVNQTKLAYACTSCQGVVRMPDTSAGVYKLQAVVDGDARLLTELTDLAMIDTLVAVHLCSVRRPVDDSTAIDMNWPDHCPAAPTALIKRRSRSASDDEIDSVQEEEVQLQLQRSVPDQNKFMKASCVLDNLKSATLFQSWLNEGAFGEAYESVQVAQMYRLISRAKSDAGKMADGSPTYIMVASLRGYGSQYCSNVQRDHTSNHVYFIIDGHGNVTQRCHSSNPGCDKVCGKPHQLPTQIYTYLFPFLPEVMSVLPQEVNDWLSGKTSMDILQSFKCKLYLARKDGVGFKGALASHRTLQLKQYKLDRGDKSVLGKRDSEDDHETRPEEQDFDASQFSFRLPGDDDEY